MSFVCPYIITFTSADALDHTSICSFLSKRNLEIASFTQMSESKRLKRLFRPNIDTSNDKTTNMLSLPFSRPALSPVTQSSLLNVGMRVRKAVTEGYKNQPKSLFRSSAKPGSANHISHRCPQLGTGGRRSSELVPYCGILNVGGFEKQRIQDEEIIPPSIFDSSLCDSPPDHEISISSELESSAHSSPLYNINKKRSLEESDRDSEPQLSRTSQRLVRQTRLSLLNKPNGRVHIKIRPRRTLCLVSEECEMVDADEFGEAAFLHPENWCQRQTEQK